MIYKHFELMRECMEKYHKIVKILFESEQSFATRTDQNGRTVGLGVDDFYKILDISKSSTFTENNDENLKLRIILLYLQAINGTTEDKLKKIIAHANISNSEVAIQTIKNLNKLLGDGFIRESDSEMRPINTKRKSRKNNSDLICSRWTPILKDIIEDCIDDKLDKNKFRVLEHNTMKGLMDRAAIGIGITTSSKQEEWLGGWHGSNQKNVPRILVFIMGGKFIIELPCVVYLHIYSLQLLIIYYFVFRCHSFRITSWLRNHCRS